MFGSIKRNLAKPEIRKEVNRSLEQLKVFGALGVFPVTALVAWWVFFIEDIDLKRVLIKVGVLFVIAAVIPWIMSLVLRISGVLRSSVNELKEQLTSEFDEELDSAIRVQVAERTATMDVQLGS